MPKFHINPETGEPGKCVAQAGNCKYGQGAPHYNNENDARQAFELSMEGKTFAQAELVKKVTAHAARAASNPNIDPIPYVSDDAVLSRMSEMQKNTVWNQDTVVRDWYFEARSEGLTHDAAFDFARTWDDLSHDIMEDEDTGYGEISAREYQGHYDELLQTYLDDPQLAKDAERLMNAVKITKGNVTIEELAELDGLDAKAVAAKATRMANTQIDRARRLRHRANLAPENMGLELEAQEAETKAGLSKKRAAKKTAPRK